MKIDGQVDVVADRYQAVVVPRCVNEDAHKDHDGCNHNSVRTDSKSFNTFLILSAVIIKISRLMYQPDVENFTYGADYIRTVPLA